MNIVEVYRKFPTEADCVAYLEQVRWHGTPICPYCQSDRTTPIPAEQRHHCNNCNTTFSVTVGTIFHHTHLPLQKWFLAISLILNAKKGIASRQLGRDVEVTKDTAWSMGMKIRKAMWEPEQRNLLQGVVEMDETYVGGKPRKGNRRDNDEPNKRGRGTKKTPVIGMAQRGGKVKAKVAPSRRVSSKNLSAMVKANVDIKNATLITDEFAGYSEIASFMAHETINHQICYAIGDIHTNTIESFWALFKRGLMGQYHWLSVRHLNKYINEFCYRLNYRESADLFALTICRGLGV